MIPAATNMTAWRELILSSFPKDIRQPAGECTTVSCYTFGDSESIRYTLHMKLKVRRASLDPDLR
jgi:hypothetical protein